MLQRIWEHRQILFVALLGILGAWFLWIVRSVLLPFFIGGVLAYALEPLVARAERGRFGRKPAVVLITLGFIAVLALVFMLTVPLLIEEISRLASMLPVWALRFRIALPQWIARLEAIEIPREVERSISSAVYRMAFDVQDALVDFAVAAPGRVLALVGGVLSLIVVPFTTVYLLLDGPRLIERAWEMVPRAYQPKLRTIAGELDVVLSGFIRGYLLVALLIALFSGTLLAILGMRFYVVLGFIAGLTNLIPYFGPFIGAIPALAVAAFDSLSMVLWVAGAYIVIQQVESLVLSPRIIGSRTGLHPLAVVASVMGGGAIAGIPGMILGVPVVGVSRVILCHVLRWALRLDGPGRGEVHAKSTQNSV